MNQDAVAAISMSFVTSTSSTTTSHTVSASAQAGDIAIIHMAANGSGGYAGAPPAGWSNTTYARTTTGTGAVWGSFAWKQLVSGDIGATLTGLPTGGGWGNSVIAYFRPSKAITANSVVGTPNQEASNGAPATQSNNVLTSNVPPNILVAGYISNGTITARTSSVTMTEIVQRTNNVYLKYKIYNIGDTLENSTVSMADFGNNMLHSFYLTIS
jgi:hypothetical protein